MKLLTLTLLLFFSIKLLSKPNHEFGFADESIPELSQFEYYRGDWTTEMEMRQEDGTFKQLAFKATITSKFLDDHKTFQSQFKGKNGFFSTDIRTFNFKTKKWHALFLNASAQRWHEFTSNMIDGKMTTVVIGGYSGKEKFDVKTIDTVVSSDHYLRDVYQSTDAMKSWRLVYKMDMKKIKY